MRCRGHKQTDKLKKGKWPRLYLPLGNPACSARFASAKAVKGVSSAGLTTIVHPDAKAAPACKQ